MPARHFSKVQGGDGAGVAERFVEGLGQGLEHIRDRGRDHLLAMFGGVQDGGLAGKLELIEAAAGLIVGIAEADGKGFDLGRRSGRHQPHHRARIHAAAQKGPQRHIRHHAFLDGFGAQGADFLHRRCIRAVVVRLKARRPVLTQGDAAGVAAVHAAHRVAAVQAA